MRILLVNKYYYPRGGDCVYTINLESLLKSKGHEIAIFSMQHPQNMPSIYSSYFPSEIDYSKPGIKSIFRPFGTSEVRKKFKKLLSDFNPDVVHLQNIHTQLSPIVAKLAYQKGIKVIWTLHDYKLICASSICLNNNKLCNLCIYNKIEVIKNKCLKDSVIGSFVGYLESIKWNRSILEKYVDTFITPSLFLKNKLIEGGFNKKKIQIMYNFMNIQNDNINYSQKENYYCYIGRISSEKGIETLINVANRLPYQLIILGDGPLLEKIKAKANNNIEFLGFQEKEVLKKKLSKAKFIVCPSECYEVFGLSNAEAQCLGTPVLGANIGGIPELIEVGFNGDLFESGNKDELKEKIISMFNKDYSKNYDKIANFAMEKYSPDNYYQQLLNIYSK